MVIIPVYNVIILPYTRIYLQMDKLKGVAEKELQEGNQESDEQDWGAGNQMQGAGDGRGEDQKYRPGNPSDRDQEDHHDEEEVYVEG